jgi:hypothetical protein
MNVLCSEGFGAHQDLVKFVAKNNIPIEDIHSIVGTGFGVIPFYMVLE